MIRSCSATTVQSTVFTSERKQTRVLRRTRFCLACTVTRPQAGFRQHDRMAPDATGEGNILALAHADILHSSILEDISGIFSKIYPVTKRKECEHRRNRNHVLRSTDPVLYPQTTVALLESTKYKILSSLLEKCRFGNVFRHGDCKIPAWAGDKMFWHQQSVFYSHNSSFTEESFILIGFCYSVADEKSARGKNCLKFNFSRVLTVQLTFSLPHSLHSFLHFMHSSEQRLSLTLQKLCRCQFSTYSLPTSLHRLQM